MADVQVSKPEVTFWLRGQSFVVEAPYSTDWIQAAKAKFGRWDVLSAHRGWMFQRRLNDIRVHDMARAAERVFGVAPRIGDLDVVAA